MVEVEEENGEDSQDNQPNDDVVGDTWVGAVSADVQFALVFLVASTVELDREEANGLSLGRLFFSHASLVL